MPGSGGTRVAHEFRYMECVQSVKNEDRTSRNLKANALEERSSERLTVKGSRHVEQNAALCLDLSDVRKEYAKKTEFLLQLFEIPSCPFYLEWAIRPYLFNGLVS